MKKLIIPFLAGVVLSCTKSTAQEPQFKEKINKEFTVSPSSVLAVYNINGPIKVEGYDGNKVMIEVNKTISAKNDEALEEGKKEFKLEFEQKDDSLIVYILEPWDSRPRRNKWHNDRRRYYDVNLDFTIKVPKSQNLVVSTVNNGDILVADVAGQMKVNNVNGKITVKNAKNANDIHTINGDVSINYLTLPPDNSKYYTLNGKLTVVFPSNLSADCEFKSFNGELYTDFENVEKLPAKITKIVKETDHGTTHKMSRGSTIRIGEGGKNLKFETFNGNIYIKKQS